MSAYEVWVVESHRVDDIEGPWEIEAVEYGLWAKDGATARVAKENGNAKDPRNLLPELRWRSRRYVPEAKP